MSCTEDIQKTPQTDEQLVVAISRSDANAFKELYYRYYQSLIRFAWYRVRSMDTARDLVQEIFLRVWIKRQSLNPAKSIKSYLYTALHNAIINYSKLGSTRTVSSTSIDNDREFGIENNLDAIIDAKTALEYLPEKLKTVFILSRFEGYKFSEIAEICNISVKAVEKRMMQAFILLKKQFR